MADNLVFENPRVLSVVCSNPTTPASGDPVRFGYLCGVAVTDESAGGNPTGYTSVDFGHAVYDLSVKAVDDDGNSAVAVGDALFYVDADTPKLSKKQTGYFFGFAMEIVTTGSTGTIQVLRTPTAGSGAIGSGAVTAAKIAADAVTTAKILNANVTAAKLTTTMQKGFIPLDITTMKIIGSNVIANTTEGLFPDGNTAPSLQRVNAATDKALRVIWAASSSVETQFAPVPKPPDLDGAAALTLHLMMGKDTNTDNAVTVTAGIYDGVGDTDAGGATAALAAATLAEYTVSLAAGDLAEHPGFLNICLTPGTHTTDAIWLYAAWIEYTRK